MQIVIGVAILICLAMAAGLFIVIRKIAFSDGDLPVTSEWIDELSIERYRPMMRLLGDEDLTFLRSQPGFTPRMAAKLRIQRCRIFRGYLRSLNADFRRVCAALKLIMLHSEDDRPDLAEVLVRHQMMFAMGLMAVEFRLFLYRWDLCDVDVTGLVKVFDAMRLELRRLVPSAAGAVA